MAETLDNHIYSLNLYPYDEPGRNAATTITIAPPTGARFGIKFRYDGGGTSVRAEVEWRWRRRMTPAAAYTEDPYGGEVWVAWDGADLDSGTYTVVTDEDEWGPWQTYVVGSYTPTVYIAEGDKFVVGSLVSHKSLHVPYDISKYDYAQLQVRARLYGPGGITSEWAVIQRTFIFRPTITEVGGWLNDDGTATLQGITNWTRQNNLLTVEYWSGVYVARQLAPQQSYEVPDDWTVTAPPEAIVKVGTDSYALYPRLAFTTGDGALVAFGYSLDGQVILTEPTPATPIPEPTVTIDADGNVSIDGSYDDVTAYATYTDEEGNTYQERLDLVEEGGSWVAALQTPPFDVEFEVAVVVTVGDDWQRYVQTVFVKGDGLVHFDWPATDSHFAIRYNPDRQVTVARLADIVSVAGRALPISRQSDSRTSSMTMTGTLINPAEDAYNGDGWLSALEVFNEPHDWIFRTPNGMRRRVMVESYTPAWKTQSANRVMDVTIVMQEVADDGLV